MLGLGVYGPRLLMLCKGFIALLGCVCPNNKYSFVVWSPFGVFNGWVKYRSGDTPKSASLFHAVL